MCRPAHHDTRVKDPTSWLRAAPARSHTCKRPVPPTEDWISDMSAPSRRLPGPDRAAPAVRLGRTITVGIIGAGRVGAVLGAALDRAGHRVVAASGVSAASLARIERLLPSTRLLPADQVPVGRGSAADRRTRRRAGRSGPRSGRGRARSGPGLVVAHTSGAHGIDVLAPAAAVGAHPLALHPAMTFTGTAGRPRPPRRPASRSASPRRTDLRPLATRLVADLGGSVEWIAEAARPLYHAALAHGAQPPGHAGQRGDGPAARRRRGPPRAGPRRRCCGASLENTLQPRRRGADRAGRPGRRRHHRAARGRPARGRAGLGAGLPGPGPPHGRPGDRVRPAAARATPSRCSACWPGPRPKRYRPDASSTGAHGRHDPGRARSQRGRRCAGGSRS